jgi:hypothetical protein
MMFAKAKLFGDEVTADAVLRPLILRRRSGSANKSPPSTKTFGIIGRSRSSTVVTAPSSLRTRVQAANFLSRR